MDLHGSTRTRPSGHCKHPAALVVTGNDRMEPVCTLCGAVLPYDVTGGRGPVPPPRTVPETDTRDGV